MKIVEDNDAPCVDYLSQVMDAKFSYAIPQINNIMGVKLTPIPSKPNQLASVTSSGATAQQGGEGAEKDPRIEKMTENLNNGRESKNVGNPVST